MGKSASRGAEPIAPVPPMGRPIAGTGGGCCSRTSSCASACVRDGRVWVSSVHADTCARRALHLVGGSTDRSPRSIDLRRHVTRVGVDIEDDRRSRTFEGDHFKCSHGASILMRQREVARYGLRGTQVGEASHLGPSEISKSVLGLEVVTDSGSEGGPRTTNHWSRLLQERPSQCAGHCLLEMTVSPKLWPTVGTCAPVWATAQLESRTWAMPSRRIGVGTCSTDLSVKGQSSTVTLMTSNLLRDLCEERGVRGSELPTHLNRA